MASRPRRNRGSRRFAHERNPGELQAPEGSGLTNEKTEQGASETDDAHLHEALAALHTALEEAETIDAQLAGELQGAIQEIRSKLEDANAVELEPPTLDRLQDLVLRFETAHPAFSNVTGRVVRTLARLGI
ncbi:MAG: DUF4404 family protein [Myxococcota bacterium]